MLKRNTRLALFLVSLLAFAGCSATLASSITTQPTNQIVCAGSRVGFTAANANPTTNVQWQRSTNGGVMWTDIAGANLATTTFTAQPSENGDEYRAVFSNSAGNVASDAATLAVNTAPAIATQPASQIANAGQSASFSAATIGYSHSNGAMAGQHGRGRYMEQHRRRELDLLRPYGAVRRKRQFVSRHLYQFLRQRDDQLADADR